MTIEKPKTFKRLMIIVWTWKKGGLKEDYDTWWVGKEKSDDKVIRIDQHNSEESNQQIYNLVASSVEDHNIYIFLHRSHNYSQEDVNRLLINFKRNHQEIYKKRSPIKCFLFGEERDYIYINTQKTGLLGAKGTFGSKPIGVEVIQDIERKILITKYFNKVWNYYSYEFKKKIYELKQEICLSFPELIVKKEKVAAADIYLKIMEKELIYLRLSSLTNNLEYASDEELSLIEHERISGKSFIFDDCNENLLRIYGNETKDAYEKLVQYINQQLFNSELNVPILPSYQRMQELRKKFETLLSTMPEATFY